MGVSVLEQNRLTDVPSSSSPRQCARTQSTRPSFHEDDCGTVTPETNAPYGVAKEALLVGAQAYREQYGLDAISSCRRTSTGRATTSTSRPRT
jgi:hypothetical protein